MKYVLSLMVLSVVTAAVALASDPIQSILDTARASCERLDNGKFDAKDAVTLVKLAGDAQTDRIIDESRFHCSSSRSLFCGSGGCDLHVVIGSKSWKFQVEGWRIVDWNNRPILLLARDGGWCGGAGSQLCYGAVSWSAGHLMTVLPPGR